MDTQIIDHTEDDDKFQIDHDVWIAKEVTKMGFPVAGRIKDIYEDAVICIPPLFKFDWNEKRVKVGRVLEVLGDTRSDFPLDFVIQIEDGTQVRCMYGGTYPCYFALPENTEDLFR